METSFKGIITPYIDPVFSITSRFRKDLNINKVNLGVGVYRDSFGKSQILEVVRNVRKELANDMSQTNDYLNMDGLDTLVNGTLNLLFGERCPEVSNGLIQGVQTLSGTGAYRLAIELLSKYHNVSCFYCSNPTWPIHVSMLEYLKIKDIRRYKYYDEKIRDIAWQEMVDTLNTAPENAAVVLQGCGHNPTGLDLSEEQWNIIAKILIDRKLIPILDVAYLGFVTGSIEKDSYAPRLLHSLGKEMLVCVSYSKNLGLYNERVGVLAWMAANKEVSSLIKDSLCFTIRNNYSNPPAHGAKVASRIINDPELTTFWKHELKDMSVRVQNMRNGLHDRLVKLKTPGDWSFIKKQQGLFSYTGLTKKQISYLEKTYSIFMLDTGRINISALAEYNLDYVATSINEAIMSNRE